MESGAMDRIREQILENRLIELSAAGDVEGVKELISMGVNVNTQNAVNGWTPLHWACKRGYIRVAVLLLKEGASKDIQANSGELPASVCTNVQILELLSGTPSFAETSRLQDDFDRHGLINNSTRNSPLSPSSRPGHARPAMSNSTEAIAVHQDCLVLKIRLSNSKDPDFVEVEIPRRDLGYAALLQVCCNELNLQPGLIERLRKLPNTRLRNDADIRRLRDFQEIEVVTHASNEQACNGAIPTQTTLTPANVYQSISKKDQTILY